MVTKGAVSPKSSKLVTKDSITLTINGRRFKFSVGDGTGDVSPAETLTETLRKRLQITGSKESCGVGACGCCAVIVNGDAVDQRRNVHRHARRGGPAGRAARWDGPLHHPATADPQAADRAEPDRRQSRRTVLLHARPTRVALDRRARNLIPDHVHRA